MRMKNNLTQYLNETYTNTVSRNCIKIILQSKTEEEYIEKIEKEIKKKITDIIEIKQSISVVDQLITTLLFNEEASSLDGYNDTVKFYIEESNKLCNELHVRNKNLHDYIDILAIAKTNCDMNGELINNEQNLIKQFGEKP